MSKLSKNEENKASLNVSLRDVPFPSSSFNEALFSRGRE